MSGTYTTGKGLHYIYVPVPHLSLIPSRLRPGSKIIIRGSVLGDANSFIFELHKENDSTIPFHFNPRIDENPCSIALNSRDNGTWGPIELCKPENFPFARGTAFEALIEVTEECYKVIVNDKTLVEFKHRCPIDSPTHFCIKGQVWIDGISYEESLSGPLQAILPKTLKIGSIYTIVGHPIGKAANFRVWVHTTKVDDEANITLLVINPRLGDGVVVRNTGIDKWGVEERSGGMPFSDGTKFLMTIRMCTDHFEIKINGKDFATYKHRTDLDIAKLLYIDGDVSLESVVIYHMPHHCKI